MEARWKDLTNAEFPTPEVHGVQGERITGLSVGSDLLVGGNSSLVSELQPMQLKIGMGNANPVGNSAVERPKAP